MTWNEVAQRNAFGQTLVDLAEKFPQLVVLDADVSSSTQTIHFGKKYPHRFFNVGVAEANMVDIAGGMATCGLHPVASTFAVFLSLKCADQIRNVVCYNNLNVVLAGNYAGLSDSYDGASHQSILDIAIMRAMPNMKVIVPADSVELSQALETAITLNGPVYLRICRNPSPVLFENETPFKFGKIRKITEGNDITIAACGIPVSMAIEASEELKKQNISAEVLNISTIKPLDIETLVRSVQKTKKIITVEEHSIIGGLGSAVAEALATNSPVKMGMIGIRDTFTETGSYAELLAKYGLSKKNIINQVLTLIN
jgi:transketolase